MRGVPHRHLYHLVPFVVAAFVAAFLIAIMSIAAVAQEQGGSDAEAFIKSQLLSLNQLTARAAGQQSDMMSIGQLRQSAATVIENATLISILTRRTFGDYSEDVLEDGESYFDDAEEWDMLQKAHEERLQSAFRSRLIADLVALAGDLGQLRLVSWQAESETEGTAVVASSDREFTCHLRRIAGRWVVVEASLEGLRVSRHYRSLVRDIIDAEYSLEVLEARLGEVPYIAIEDFSTTPPGQLPRGWGWRRKKHRNDEKLYEVHDSDGRFYLAAQDSGASVILMRAAHWNPRTHPIMTWCWRADALPPGGDERYDHTNDSAAGIYVFYSKNWLSIPKHIKYVWSTTLPEGTIGRRNKIFRPYFVVVESGAESVGKWTFEVMDLVAPHKRVYGGKPKKRTLGLGILTDANSTKSFAEAFYADIRVWPRSALEQGLITDYCNCSGGSAAVSDLEPDCAPLPTSPETITASAVQ